MCFPQFSWLSNVAFMQSLTFNRPGVAGRFYKHLFHSLISSVSHSVILFLPNRQNIINHKLLEQRTNNFEKIFTTPCVVHITYHMLRVTYHMSRVTCDNFNVYASGHMVQSLQTEQESNPCHKFVIYGVSLLMTVILQRAVNGFYLEEMPMQVMCYIEYQMIADTQTQLSVFEFVQKL